MNPSPEAGVRGQSPHEGVAARTACRTSYADVSVATDKKRVLIVDDEQNILSSLRRLFRREDYELITTNDPGEAMRVMEATPVHVIISDYRMPGMTGTQLLRAVQSRWPDTVRIVLSGYSEVRGIIDAINEGAIYKFIVKPWNDEEILLNVRRAVEQYQLAMENRRLVEAIAQQNQQLRELNRRLDQRATDASSGQAVAQELLEAIHAGLIVVDPSGLIVMANRKAWNMLQLTEGEFIGLPAIEILPGGLTEAFRTSTSSDCASAAGQLEVEGRKCEWRLGAVEDDGTHRGTIITLWDGLTCLS